MQSPNDQADAAVVADRFMNLTRCLGGRTIASGLICPHCDSHDPDNECRSGKVVLRETYNDSPEDYKGWMVHEGAAKRMAPGVKLFPGPHEKHLYTKKELAKAEFADDGWPNPDTAASLEPEEETAVSNEMTIKQIAEIVEARKQELAKYRDRLRELLDELSDLDDHCDQAEAHLEDAADSLSQLV